MKDARGHGSNGTGRKTFPLPRAPFREGGQPVNGNDHAAAHFARGSGQTDKTHPVPIHDAHAGQALVRKFRAGAQARRDYLNSYPVR